MNLKRYRISLFLILASFFPFVFPATDINAKALNLVTYEAIDRISVGWNLLEDDEYSIKPDMSDDGRFVVYQTKAINLVDKGRVPSIGSSYIALYDRVTGKAQYVTFREDGLEMNGENIDPVISGDGNFIAFTSTNQWVVTPPFYYRGVAVQDRITKEFFNVATSSAGENANKDAYSPSINQNGRYIAFVSNATNLIVGTPEKQTNIYVKDMWTGNIGIASVTKDWYLGSGFSRLPSINADGSRVAFVSDSRNFVPGNGNGEYQVFVKDGITGDLFVVSAKQNGEIGNCESSEPSISDDGTLVAFQSCATNFGVSSRFTSDIFVKNLKTGGLECISCAMGSNTLVGGAEHPAISGDGRYVFFSTKSGTLGVPDTNGVADVYVKDRQTGEVAKISVGYDGSEPNNKSTRPATNADGEYVSFESYADNIVPDDSNEKPDVFLAYRKPETPILIDPAQSSISNDRVFTFSWYRAERAFSYSFELLQSSDDTMIHTKKYVTDHICSDTTCTISLHEVYLPDVYGSGEFKWRVAGRSGQISGNWSSFNELTILGLDPPVLVSPENELATQAKHMMYHWQPVADADNYTLEVKNITADTIIHNVVYAASLICDDAVCSVAVPDTLSLGNYRWNVAGMKGELVGPWSPYNTFTVTPEQTKLRSPGIDANVYGGRPTFRWYQDADATSYMIEFYDPSDTLIGEWQKNPVCDPYCSYRIPNTMDLGGGYGDYDWRVRTITRGIAGPWSEMRTFTYTQLERTWQISPENGFPTADTTPTFEWAEITGATMYLFQIRLPDDSLVGNYLVSDADFCVDGGTCTWEFTEDLPLGEYKWHVRAKNGRNFGRWTAYRNISITSE